MLRLPLLLSQLSVELIPLCRISLSVFMFFSLYLWCSVLSLYHILRYVCVCVCVKSYSSWDLLGFLNLWIGVFYVFWKILSKLCLWLIFSSFLLLELWLNMLDFFHSTSLSLCFCNRFYWGIIHIPYNF